MRAATIGEATVLARLSLATADQLELWADRVLDAGVHRISAHAQTDVLANRLMQAGVVPESEPEDAAHIAMATLHGFRYLVTWNFAHFVGPDAKYRVFAALRDWGYAPALFATPEELLEGSSP